ncbi:MAG: ribosome-associated translation inhibitor RaiA [Lentisphaerae bacterium]|nr:ribosome-associated translation inhibitor RaiA [Lentisphaerota bacterium]
MTVEITERHMQNMPDVSDYAREKGERLVNEFPRVERVHIILDTFKGRYLAEIVVQAKNHIRLEASDTTSSMRASIDGATEKTEKQLRKLRDKVQDHRNAMKQTEASRLAPEDEGEEEA